MAPKGQPVRAEETAVQVAVRVRPLLPKEVLHGQQTCVHINPDKQSLTLGTNRHFHFQHILDEACSQETVYGHCVQALLEAFFQGFNVTVVAYGQTGSGKTYTIGEASISSISEDEQGIIPRAMAEIFKLVDENDLIDYTIRVSYLEVYKEEFRDLLEVQTSSKDILIREDDKGNVVLCGVKETEVEGLDEVLSLLEVGNAAKHTGATQVNTHSSRSHTIFTVTMEQRRGVGRVTRMTSGDDGPTLAFGQVLSSKFHFVDLAGSERILKTGNTGERLKESIQINTGLLALGNVISALGDPKRKSSHIPYRDSKITRILKDSLGGNAKTVMISCISPSASDFDETLNTLNYANRAQNIKNKATINCKKEAERVENLQQQIKSLQRALEQRHRSETRILNRFDPAKSVPRRSTEEHVSRLMAECAHYRTCTDTGYLLLMDLLSEGGLSSAHMQRIRDWMCTVEEERSEVTSASGLDSGIESSSVEELTAELSRRQAKSKGSLSFQNPSGVEKDRFIEDLKSQIQKLEDENRDFLLALEDAMEQYKLQSDKLQEQQDEITRLQTHLEQRKSDLSVTALLEDVHLLNIGGRPNTAPLIKKHSHIVDQSKLLPLRIPSQKKISDSVVSLSKELKMSFQSGTQKLVSSLEEADTVLFRHFSEDSDFSTDSDKEGHKENDEFDGESNKSLPSHRFCVPAKYKKKEQLALRNTPTDERDSKWRLRQAEQKIRELAINIRMKEELIKELVKTGKEAQAMNKQYCLKIAELEAEAEQVGMEVSENQRHLQELEGKDTRDPVEKSKLQEYRKKIAAAESKVQALSNDIVRVSSRIEDLEKELTEKNGQLCQGSGYDQQRIRDEINNLRHEKELLLKQRVDIDEKLRQGNLLSAECLTREEYREISKLSHFVTVSVLPYFTVLQVVTLREEEHKLQICFSELEMKLEEQQGLVSWLEVALERTRLEMDRQLTLQQKEHERNIQLLLKQCQGQMGEGLAGSKRQYEGRIQMLENELSRYMWAYQELSQRLNKMAMPPLNAPGNQVKTPPIDGRVLHNTDRPVSLVGCADENNINLNSQPPGLERNLRPREELINAPLPPTWRRSSLPSEEQAGLEELRHRDTVIEPLSHRVVQPNDGVCQRPRMFLPKSRQNVRRCNISVMPLTSNVDMIDVRRNPL
uniref:Kinesin motor domain-containing protein n=1 Tax=Pyxicephalus adspersus TaxID=30357 RepID=A0AAV3AVP2_PYXAD|nr:TPA: hypothetical protein GDO54_007742 [Pyxicephalus adspersus]